MASEGSSAACSAVIESPRGSECSSLCGFDDSSSDGVILAGALKHDGDFESEDWRNLRAENSRLRKELAQMKKQMRAIFGMAKAIGMLSSSEQGGELSGGFMSFF